MSMSMDVPRTKIERMVAITLLLLLLFTSVETGMHVFELGLGH